jgi:hypothetical protein
MKLHTSDLWLGMGLALAALFMRLPFRSQFLYHWDSVNFALSLEHYDVRLHQPHPPGYILYSMLGRLINLVVHDANASLVWISLLSGVLGVVALYWLGAIMFDRQVGTAAALLALTNPMHWFYSEIALSYALEFLLVTIVAGLCYLQFTGSRRIWPWSAILLGVAGGVRQNDLVFLFPVWLLSLYDLSWRQRAASIAILGMVVAAWGWPMAALSGGPAGYLAALGTESSGVASESSLFSLRQLGLNGVRMVIYLGYGLLLGAVSLFWGVWFLGRRVRAQLLMDRRAWVLAFWIGPAACFYILVHLRQHGHIFTFLPALILLTALATIQLGRRLAGFTLVRPLASVLMAVLIVANGLFFLLAPASLLGSERLPLQTPSRLTISQRDSFLGQRIGYIQTHFEPDSTVILATDLNFRYPDFYLREFQSTSLSYQLGENITVLPDYVRTLVLFDDVTLPQFSTDAGFQVLPLPGGGSIRYITWDSSHQVKLSLSFFEVQKK